MSKPTPRPWELCDVRALVIDKGRTGVVANTAGPFTDIEQAEANAALIVKAVNMHDELIAALKIIANEANREAKDIGSSARRGDQSKADTFRYIRDHARDLLAKAEGKE